MDLVMCFNKLKDTVFGSKPDLESGQTEYEGVRHTIEVKYNGKKKSGHAKYGCTKGTAKLMNVGDYAVLPDGQAPGLYQAIINLYGKKSAKSRSIQGQKKKVWRIK